MHRHSIFCIVPPVVFERIARNGSDAQREAALDTLSRDHSLRAARLQNAVLRGDGALHADALATAEPGKPKRTIYDAKGGENLPGEPVAHEGEAPSSRDPAVNEAYDGLGATYDFFREMFERDSIDDDGCRSMASFTSARLRQRLLERPADGLRRRRRRALQPVHSPLDVIGHELTHGVTEDEAGPSTGSSRVPQRVDVRCLRLAGEADSSDQTAERGRLADRRWAPGRESTVSHSAR